MIVVDTSAIITIIDREPNFEQTATRLIARSQKHIPATVIIEATIVLSRNHDDPKAVLGDWIAMAGATVISIDEMIASEAQMTFLRFGKGRHKAGLNFGDCFSYAVAKVLNAPLLYIGSDFAQTDIRAA
jgi:ribonuclease VapC